MTDALAAPPSRFVSLDAFRGLTVAAMILVNNPGSWAHVHWPLEHARWHGWTPTDLIFPFFLFIIGMAVPFSRRVTVAEAARRSAVLLFLGLFMAAFPYFDLGTVRIPGVLQRIAVCYLAAFALHHRARWRTEAAAAVALLALYWLLMTRVPVPGGLPPTVEPETNLGAWLDRALLSGHLWKQSRTWDPEGLLSTLPAIATTLFGVLAGRWIRADAAPGRRTAGLVAAGVIGMIAGLLWDRAFPINKSLWTSSYVLFTAGMAAALFALVYWVTDAAGHRRWAAPFVVFGVNAIFVFVASGLLAKVLYLVHVPSGGASIPLQAWLHETLFARWLPPRDASLAYALANVLLWFLILLAMHRRGVHVKV